jgi:lipoate synthase
MLPSDEEMEVIAVEILVHDLAETVQTLIEANKARPDLIAENRDDILESASKIFQEIGAIQ